MRRVRKVTLTWDEVPPERFSVSYVRHDGVEHSKSLRKNSDETVEDFVQRIGRVCIGAAKGDLT